MVEGLLSKNAKVIVAGRSKEKFNIRFDAIDKRNLFFKQIDILNGDSIVRCINEIANEFGKIDVLINNAHNAKGSGQENMSDEDWSYTLDGVLGATHKCIKVVIPIMKKQQFGKIINISSMYGMISPDFRLYEGDSCEKYTNPPHYGAAKAGINQITKYFAVLLGKYNIQVNAISPGPFPKVNIQHDNPIFVERLKMKNPTLKIGKPDDLKGITILLSSNASDFITGQIIQVDGGWTIW
jgi:gluconate 5-dehydrogenase